MEDDIHPARTKKRFCVRGHDTFLDGGRTKDGRCFRCQQTHLKSYREKYGLKPKTTRTGRKRRLYSGEDILRSIEFRSDLDAYDDAFWLKMIEGVPWDEALQPPFIEGSTAVASRRIQSLHYGHQHDVARVRDEPVAQLAVLASGEEVRLNGPLLDGPIPIPRTLAAQMLGIQLDELTRSCSFSGISGIGPEVPAVAQLAALAPGEMVQLIGPLLDSPIPIPRALAAQMLRASLDGLDLVVREQATVVECQPKEKRMTSQKPSTNSDRVRISSFLTRGEHEMLEEMARVEQRPKHTMVRVIIKAEIERRVAAGEMEPVGEYISPLAVVKWEEPEPSPETKEVDEQRPESPPALSEPVANGDPAARYEEPPEAMHIEDEGGGTE